MHFLTGGGQPEPRTLPEILLKSPAPIQDECAAWPLLPRQAPTCLPAPRGGGGKRVWGGGLCVCVGGGSITILGQRTKGAPPANQRLSRGSVSHSVPFWCLRVPKGESMSAGGGRRPLRTAPSLERAPLGERGGPEMDSEGSSLPRAQSGRSFRPLSRPSLPPGFSRPPLERGGNGPARGV